MSTSYIDPALAIDPIRQYSAAMDSVNLINFLRAKPSLTEKEQESIDRNVRCLKIMVTKDYWTTQDLAPLKAAIQA